MPEGATSRATLTFANARDPDDLVTVSIELSRGKIFDREDPSPGGCSGDCDGNGGVTVDELVRGVNIALGTRVLAECAAFDGGGDGQVTVDELIAAVRAALEGC